MSGVVGTASVGVLMDRETVSAALAKLGPSLLGQKLELALVAGALLAANDAKRRAPIVTGTLRRSIHIGGHTALTPDFEGHDIGGNEVDATHAQVLVGTDVEYAARIEFGFMGADSLGRTYHQSPQPYLRPAVDENLERIQQTVMTVLDGLLRAALA